MSTSEPHGHAVASAVCQLPLHACMAICTGVDGGTDILCAVVKTCIAQLLSQYPARFLVKT